MTEFQLRGLDPAPFRPLFELADAELAARGIRRLRADDAQGFPCRVSLEDARLGEELLLLPWQHHAVDSPYRALGPIYVRKAAGRADPAPGEVPESVTRRLISLRAYDQGHMMVSAEVAPGTEVAPRLRALFADARVDYVHLHNAGPGCYSCCAVRVRAARASGA